VRRRHVLVLGLSIAGLAAAVGLIAVQMGIADPDPTAPAALANLPVLTVPDLIAYERTATDARAVAVSGWLSQSPPMSCPSPAPEFNARSIERRCGDDYTWLMAEPETLVTVGETGWSARLPARPAVDPWIDGTPPLGQFRRWPDVRPLPVVVLGHVRDPRAALCRPELVAECLRRFVIDAFASAEGTALARPVDVYADIFDPATGASTSLPLQLTVDEAEALARDTAGGTLDVTSVTVRSGDELEGLDPRLPGDWPSQTLDVTWVIRGLGPTVHGGPAMARTFAIRDADGRTIDLTGAP
jgi:hypothetical protein